MDGGKDPSLEPAVNGYINCENGVKIFFAGVFTPLSTPSSPRFGDKNRWPYFALSHDLMIDISLRLMSAVYD